MMNILKMAIYWGNDPQPSPVIIKGISDSKEEIV